MKKTKFLSALVMGALVGAMTLCTTSPANAASNIVINGTGGGGDTWIYGYSENDTLWTSDSNMGDHDEDYLKWVGSDIEDDITLTSGGSLETHHSNANGILNAQGGNLKVSEGVLTIGSGSSIANAVSLNVAGGTLAVSGGSVVIGSGDTISGAINATAGTVTFDGTQTLNSTNYTIGGSTATVIDGTVTSNISLAGTNGITVNANKQLTISANNIDGTLNNDGKVIISDGSLDNAISGNGATEITGNVTNNSTITQSSGGVKITSGSLTTNASNVTGTVTNDVVDGYILTGGTNTNQINRTGSTGRTKIDAGANTVTNQAAIQQDLYVATGTFDNSTGGSVTGNTTIDSGATVDNTAGSLNSVTNDGTLNITGGSIASITNNATATQGVYQSTGVVTNVTNNGGAYTQSGGTATNVNNSGTYTLTGGGITNFSQSAGDLNLSNGVSLTVTNATNPLTSAINAITGGNVTLGDAGDTTGTLIIENGLSTNRAKVTTVGAGANTLIIRGKGTELTTLTDTNLENGIVTVGNGTDASTLNLSDNSVIAKEITLTVASASKLKVAGTAQAVINSGDSWNGSIEQSSTSTITFLDNVVKDSDNATLKATSGTINIGDGTTSGALTLNNAGDSIAKDVILTIHDDSAMSMSKGNVTLDNDTVAGTKDTWDGAINLSGGTLKLSGRDDTTDATKTFNQSGGKLIIDDSGSLTLDTSDSKIASSSEVVLGEATNNTKGTLVVNNGSANQAKVTTAGTGASSFSITGANTTFTTLTGTNIARGSVTVGNGTNASVLNLANNSIIARAVALTVEEGSTMNLSGSAQATINSGDTWKGTINQTGGTLNVFDNVVKNASTAKLTSNGGNIVIGGTSAGTLNLNNADDSIAAATNVTINENGKLAQSKGNVVLNSGDTWNGAIDLSGGNLKFIDRNDTTNATKSYKQTGGELTLTNSTLSMADSSLISGGDLIVDKDSTYNSLSKAFTVDNLTNAGLINGINSGYENYAVDTGFYVGDGASDKQGDFTVDLRARSRFSKNYDSYGSDSATIYASNGTDGVLKVSDWVLNGDLYGYDAPLDRRISMKKLFKGTVAAGHKIEFTSTNKEVLTPIGWYRLNSMGKGNYSFDLARFNPGVYRGQVTKMAQYQNQLMIDDMLFNHTMLDQGFKGNDYIASNPNRLASATDLYPPYQYSRKDGGLWVKMYGTFEKLNMNHGLNVGNNAYGTLIGADLGLRDLKHGWQFMPTAYVGYNGAHQYWHGYGGYQNGGQLGLMGTWYKDNFIIGTMVYGGMYNNEMDTPRGNDDTLGYFVGSSVKAAYNWRLGRDWSLQPNLLVAYNFFGKENWHTDFGQMSMMSGMLHGVNIAPGLNLIWEKDTFSMYGTVQYMYNINQSVGGRAGYVGLPTVHMDRGYIQYGLGFNKRFGDRFSGFLQAVMRNAGRTGVGLQAGFQWMFGKNSSNDGIQKGDITPELKETEVILKHNKA